MKKQAHTGIQLEMQGKGGNPKLAGSGIGYFAYYEGEPEEVFIDSNQKIHNRKRVVFLSQKFNDAEGDFCLPKPYKFDSDGKLKEYGDQLAYLEDKYSFTILGSIVSPFLKHKEPLLRIDSIDDYERTAKLRNNDLRMFRVDEDGKGNIVVYVEAKEGEEKKGNGNLLLRIQGTDGNGNIHLINTGKFSVTQIDKDDKKVLQLLMDNTEGNEKYKVEFKDGRRFEINKNGTKIVTEKFELKGKETLKSILLDLLKAIRNLKFTAPGGTTMKPPLNLTEFSDLGKRIEDYMKVEEV